MSRADNDSNSSFPMSSPVDSDDLFCALHRLIEKTRATRIYGQNAYNIHNVINMEQSLCQCGRRHRRDIEDEQIDIPEVQMNPVLEYCKHIILEYGFLLPLLTFLGFFFYFSWTKLKKTFGSLFQ